MVLRVRTKTTTMWSDRKMEVGALAQSVRCATVPMRHLRQVKTQITGACLKHSDFIKIDNWIEMYLTAVHKKPFSKIERVRRVRWTNTCPTADAK